MGDTLNSIARQFNTTVEAIAAANNIQNPDALLVGATLIIPQPVQ
ncbi:MAG TPA: LysM domain-containing protein [Chloroflexota bacterium]|nr:LysM domain-containing protein [Chloroflexota bacterium]